MEAIAIIPIKSYSERVPRKNFQCVNGKPLYQWGIIKAVNSFVFDEIWVDTDSEAVKTFCKCFIDVRVLDRAPEMNDANGSELLWKGATRINKKPNLWSLIHVTAPFLSIETIKESVGVLQKYQWFDSSLTVKKLDSHFAWNNSQPLYDTVGFGRTQDDPNIMVSETSGIYTIRHESLFYTKSRIGLRPFPIIVGDKEATDIDTQYDLSKATGNTI